MLLRLLPVLLLTGCTVTPLDPVPDPLPETLEWSLAAVDDAEGAFLGLETRENDSGSLDDLFFEPGVRVSRVVRGSPAEAAGIEVGDVVLSLGGHETNEPETLEGLVRSADPGASVELSVQRGDTVFGVPITLRGLGSETPRPEVLFRKDPARSRAGWSTTRGGVMLVSTPPDGPFPRAGIPVGSVVREVEGEPVASDRELIRRLQAEEPGAKVEVRWTDGEGGEHRTKVGLVEQPTRVTRFVIPIVYHYSADAEGESTRTTIGNLWIIWLLRYEREGEEKKWSFLRFFKYSTGVGELSE